MKGFGTAAIVLRCPALQDRHQSLDNPQISGARTALAVGCDRATDAVQNLVAIAGNLSFTAIVGRCDAAEWIAGGQRHVIGDRPGKAAITAGQDIAGAIEVEAGQADGVSELGVAPPFPASASRACAPSGQTVGRYEHRLLHQLGTGEDRAVVQVWEPDDNLDPHDRSSTPSAAKVLTGRPAS